MIRGLDLIDANNKKLASIRGTLYISLSETAKKYKVSRNRILALIASGRVPGAYRVGPVWIIPSTWKYKKIKRKYTKSFPQVKAKKPLNTFFLEDPSDLLTRIKK